MKPSLNKSLNGRVLNHYYDEDVLKEINKVNKNLKEYEIKVDYYDKIDEPVHHYYGNNSGFTNQRPLMICLLHHKRCVSSLFFVRVRRNGKIYIDINVAT